MKIYVLLLLLPVISFAQELKDVSLSSIKSPSSPGFTILGVQPKDVSRPKDFNSFELSLLNAVSNNNTYSLPANFAVEVTPYWLKHRSITFDKLEKEANVDKVFGRTFSISVATAQRNNQVDQTIKISQLGIGFRALLSQGEQAELMQLNSIISENTFIEESANFYGIILAGTSGYLEQNKGAKSTYTSNEIIALVKYPFAVLNAYATSNDPSLVAVFKRIETNQKYKDNLKFLFDKLIRSETRDADLSDVQDWKDFLLTLEPKFIDVLKKNPAWEASVQKIKDLREKRIGLIWEVAGATALESQNAKYESLSATRYGIWTTLTYRPKFTSNDKLKQKLDFALMFRYLNENTELLKGSNLDIGLRPVYDNNRFILSGELLWRKTWKVLSVTNTPPIREKTIEERYGFRWGATLGYRINQNILIEANVGKSFDNDAINAGGFLTVLGANFGFGKPVIAPK